MLYSVLALPVLAPGAGACGKSSPNGGRGGTSGSSGGGGVAGEGGMAGASGKDAGGKPCTVSDPEDSSQQTGGDAALDIKCVTTGVMKDGRPWMRVQFWGTWLPSSSFYSWYCTVTLSGGSGEIGAVTRQRHSGTDATLVKGAVVEAATTLTIEPNGFLVVFDAALAPQLSSAKIQAGVMQAQGGAIVTDDVDVPSFDATVADP